MTERAHISKWTWARVMARYDFTCATCGEPFNDGDRVDLDHVHQLAFDGPDNPGNLRPLCPPCHKRKSASDARARAKVKRIRGETGNGKKRAIRSDPKIPARADPWGKMRKNNG